MSYVHNPCVFYEVAIRLEVCALLLQGWPTSQRPWAIFLPVSYSKEPHHTHGNTWTNAISSSHTYFCWARSIVNIRHHQHDSDKTSQCIYCYACCLVGCLVYNCKRAAWNWANRGTGWPPQCCYIQCQRKMKMNMYCIWMHFGFLSVNSKLCVWSVQNLSDDATVTVDLLRLS